VYLLGNCPHVFIMPPQQVNVPTSTESKATTTQAGRFSPVSFGAGVVIAAIVAGIVGVLWLSPSVSQNSKGPGETSKTSAAHVYYDKVKGKLVTDSQVTDQYNSKTFADTIVSSPLSGADIVMSVPNETVIFDQKKSDDGRIIYGTLLTNLTFEWEIMIGYSANTVKTGELVGNRQPSGTRIPGVLVFGYDVEKNFIIFAEKVPAYAWIHEVSPGGELVALKQADCYPCGGGTYSFYIVDTTGKARDYKDLGPLYDVKFTGPRSFRYTTASYEGCDGMGCVLPGEVKEGSL